MKSIKHRVKKNVESFKNHKSNAVKKVKWIVHKAVKKHHHRFRKSMHAVNTLAIHLEYVGLFVVSILWIIWLSTFASFGAGIQDNAYLIYPFKEIPTVECRTMHYDDITAEDNCIVDFPVAEGADFSKYTDNDIYRGIYTVLWGARYEWDSWIQEGAHRGSHAWTDIAASRWTNIYAIGKWKIEFAWEKPGWGNVVIQSVKYKGVIYETIYAHMDVIDVVGGQTILQWEKIWEVGNTWMTFGALWGYHLHWQMNIWDTYSYLGCPAEDLQKGHMHIINNGKCREALERNTVDPVKLVEESRAWLRKVVDVVIDDPIVEEIVDEPKSEFIAVQVHEVADTTESDVVVSETEVAVTASTDVIDEGTKLIEVGVIETSIEDEIMEDDTPEVTEAVIDLNLNTVDLDEIPKQQLTFTAQKFIEDNSIVFTYEKVDSKSTNLLMKITNKKTGLPFHWIMPISFQFMSNWSDVNIDREVVKLVSNWEVSNIITHEENSESKVSILVDLWKWWVVEL